MYNLKPTQQYSSTCNPYLPCQSTTASYFTFSHIYTSIAPAQVSTDWAVLSVWSTPSAPQVGDTVIFSMQFTAISSTGPFPQSVYVECTIDGANCGRGTILYPGPVGALYTLNANKHPWMATLGAHILTWEIDTTNDPNPSNNSGSLAFYVAAPVTSQPFDFNITASPKILILHPNQQGNAAIFVNLVSGQATAPVTLNAVGVPASVTYAFVGVPGSVVTPPFTFPSTLTFTYLGSTASSSGTYSVMITGTGGGLTRSTNITLELIWNAAVTQPTGPTQTVTQTAFSASYVGSGFQGVKCLIATAAYGSALSPEVEILRGFRDGGIMKTKAGSAFMIAFNAWYYSFSPYVANYITRHPVAAAGTRFFLYPFIGIMFATARVYASLGYDPEIAVLFSGIMASGLIGGLYFGLPLGIARRRIRRLRGFKSQPLLEKSLAIVLLVAIGTLTVGEIFSSFGTLIVSTSIIVLSTMSLSAIVLSNLIVLGFKREYRAQRTKR